MTVGRLTAVVDDLWRQAPEARLSSAVIAASTLQVQDVAVLGSWDVAATDPAASGPRPLAHGAAAGKPGWRVAPKDDVTLSPGEAVRVVYRDQPWVLVGPEATVPPNEHDLAGLLVVATFLVHHLDSYLLSRTSGEQQMRAVADLARLDYEYVQELTFAYPAVLQPLMSAAANN